jgi:hypothetical protein
MLQLAEDSRTVGRELLFFRSGSAVPDKDDPYVIKRTTVVWLWDESQHDWQNVLTTDPANARSLPQPFSGIGERPAGDKLMSVGWQLSAPIL